MLNAWCRWLNTNSEKFKLTINNRNRDMDRLEKEILFAEADDGMDELRDAYNDIIMRNLREGCQGIEREKKQVRNTTGYMWRALPMDDRYGIKNE